MTPIRMDYSNVTYVADGCFDLPAAVIKREDGGEEVETVWELSEDEIEQLVREKKIYLYIMGRQVPPVFLTTEPCFIPEQEGDRT